MKQSIDQIKAILAAINQNWDSNSIHQIVSSMRSIIAAINQNWDSFSDEEQETWENFIAGLDELL